MIGVQKINNLDQFENKSLLIVDDDNPFRERLARAMGKKGFIVFKTTGWEFVLTAYKTFPGNLFLKKLDANCIDFFLIQYIGSLGFSWVTNSSTVLNFCI